MRRAFLLALIACGAAFASEEAGHSKGISVDAWKAINFAFLAAGIVYLAIKTGKPLMQQRREDILYDLKTAQERARVAEQKAAEVEKRLAGLEAEEARMKENSRAEMQAEAARIEEETKHLLAKVEHAAQTEIAAAGKEAVAKLRAEAASLALKLAEQKVASRLDPAGQAALVDRFVASLRGQEGKN